MDLEILNMIISAIAIPISIAVPIGIIIYDNRKKNKENIKNEYNKAFEKILNCDIILENAKLINEMYILNEEFCKNKYSEEKLKEIKTNAHLLNNIAYNNKAKFTTLISIFEEKKKLCEAAKIDITSDNATDIIKEYNKNLKVAEKIHSRSDSEEDSWKLTTTKLLKKIEDLK